eukprot:4098519-Prymnesium_polylepis.1
MQLDEIVHSLAVMLVWVRTIKVFSVFQGVGAFVYMLSMIFIDVVRWLLLYVIALVACSCAIYVLYWARRRFLAEAMDISLIYFSDISLSSKIQSCFNISSPQDGISLSKFPM